LLVTTDANECGKPRNARIGKFEKTKRHPLADCWRVLTLSIGEACPDAKLGFIVEQAEQRTESAAMFARPWLMAYHGCVGIEE
tara:strand:+ start:1241 stop:1489 length:249 start_codon:yes stop_codon:yes gene_type:complete